ncbi:MAG: hypothetical protein LBJ14_05765 [Desulfarculales bacterium]|jgi:hypothetical protein|nr:hypothetical protein [Desulfarculales bacterium]
MEALQIWHGLDFRERLEEVNQMVCLISEFAGAVSATDWGLSREAWNGLFSLSLSLTKVMGELVKETKKEVPRPSLRGA